MARLNYQDAKEMANKNGGFDFKFFSLKDRETIKIRFLVSKIEDVDSHSVHNLTLPDGKKKNIECLRQPNEPVQNCPLCAMGNKPRARIYLNVVDEKTHELMVWERSAQFLDTLEGYLQRYGDLRDYIFEVERKGTGLDTEYLIYPLGQSMIPDKSVLPEPISVEGKLILDKSFQELSNYVATGVLPDSTAPTPQTQPELQRRDTAPQYNQGAPYNPQGQAPYNPQAQYQQPQSQGQPQPQGQPQASPYTPNDVNPWANNQPTPPKRNGWN